VKKLEREAKEFMKKQLATTMRNSISSGISKEKVITDIKTVITYLESIQIKLKDIMNNLSK
tara:strand:- start:251 stop:433 length:183 start_codon:yes stop_codon:yes gene_type:complete